MPDFHDRIESALRCALEGDSQAAAPSKLSDAMLYAVFPGGGRFRPALCMNVAAACSGAGPNDLAVAAAVSLEILHCASLVHDDLDCFDGSDTRRGQLAVHRKFGEGIAVLTGDALVVLAFRHLATVGASHLTKASSIIETVARAVDGETGIIAGQALEFEEAVSLEKYHRRKTGALFEGASVCGAIAADFDPAGWRAFGLALGQLYQVGDDIADVVAHPDDIGKPGKRDGLLRRPNIAIDIGVEDSVCFLMDLLDNLAPQIPSCPSKAEFIEWLLSTLRKYLSQRLRDAPSKLHKWYARKIHTSLSTAHDCEP